MRKYNIVNNSLGWLCFVIAAVTYLLTMEPTASFWDCPEFISQGAKLEVGHPPGNPIFILTARFFINFTSIENAAIAVNTMSALLSAGTILLLFWTITHLVRRMMVGRSEKELSPAQMITVMGSGLCGALLYTWSDTFWFSAVEGEVYAFSSFCTALVVWLILKWDTRADRPHADRYLVLIAYVIGISIAVHLLNLLTIPALAMVVYYRKAKKVNWGGALIALIASFAVVGFILYGLVPGFVKIAGYFELLFVNELGMSYNVGVLVYTLLLVAVLVWCVYSFYKQKSDWQMRVSFVLSAALSGLLFIGSSFIVPILLFVALVAYMILVKKLHVRLLNLVALSILVIFAGYSSYALLLIRANANPPMNQNAPDNVFALSSYLNREQYGETPLFYGPTFNSENPIVITKYDDATDEIEYERLSDGGKKSYVKAVKSNDEEPDMYVPAKERDNYVMEPNVVFPRMYSQAPSHVSGYLHWIGARDENDLESDATVLMYRDSTGNQSKEMYKYLRNRFGSYYDSDEINEYIQQQINCKVKYPSFGQNMRYFFDYQLGYMYWRYFMWNFAGRQNDLQGIYGEVTRGNWISGIPFIDNSRLGDQSLLPNDLGEGNKGHNVFYMLPLLMGLLGIAVQLMRGNEGVRQLWIVFLLFFMTGIAIVLYLNQPPNQPRERDYAFAGSFYAFAIWIGMGVYFISEIGRIICSAVSRKPDQKLTEAEKENPHGYIYGACVAAVIGLLVPLQMVSQTWDDHDRSGRYAARDFGMNYLASLDENAIIFTNGDNDTFPLWYAQEVEGFRQDVRVVNLAYLTTDWYANHMKMDAYEAPAIDFSAEEIDYANSRIEQAKIGEDYYSSVDALSSLRDLYTNPEAYNKTLRCRELNNPYMYIPVDIDAAIKSGIITSERAEIMPYDDVMIVNWTDKGIVAQNDILALDMIATSAKNGWNRPIYFAMTVPDEYYLNMGANLFATGLAYQVQPVLNITYDPRYRNIGVDTEKAYDNIINKFRWGGIPEADGNIYLDETVRRMVSTHRALICDVATALYEEGLNQDSPEKFEKAVELLNLMQEKLPADVAPYQPAMAYQIGSLYIDLGRALNSPDVVRKGVDMLVDELNVLLPYIPYIDSLIKDEIAYRKKAGIQPPKENNYLGSIRLSDYEMRIPAYIQAIVGELRRQGVTGDQIAAIFDAYHPKSLDMLTKIVNEYSGK